MTPSPTTVAALEPAQRRVDVLGVGISTVTPEIVLDVLAGWIERRERHYVCVTGVHGVMESQRDPVLLRAHNASGLTVPDGMPMVWACHRAGARWVNRVYGPDLMRAAFARATENRWRMFLYGATPQVLETLRGKLAESWPGVGIVGAISPPFRELSEVEQQETVAEINRAEPDVVWVGLSTPKQERWMHANRDELNAPVLIGVGAAFDFLAGLKKQAPSWMQRAGLEWLYRMATEPRRLWKRYAVNNPAFVAAIARRPPALRPTSTAERHCRSAVPIDGQQSVPQPLRSVDG